MSKSKTMKAAEIAERIARGENCPVCGAAWEDGALRCAPGCKWAARPPSTGNNTKFSLRPTCEAKGCDEAAVIRLAVDEHNLGTGLPLYENDCIVHMEQTIGALVTGVFGPHATITLTQEVGA